MDCSFKRGTVRLTEGVEPDWDEVAARLDFVREVCGVPVCFQRARREGDSWVVPFLSAESERHPDAADVMLERYTPYEALGAERVDVPTATVDELEVMTLLSKGEAPAVRARDLAPEEPTPGPDPEAADPESVFDGLVGMDEQKGMLIKLSTALAKHGRSAVECFHFVFVGNPGTGKTELASRLVSYLDSLGVTDGTHKMVKVSGSELMADYVGQTGNKVRRIVDSAVGGMLFIDEFYGLSVKDAGGYFYGDVYHYEKRFVPPETWAGQEIALVFDGVYRNATVTLNGTQVAWHAYGYTPFSARLTKALLPGRENVLEVVADNSELPNARWYTGGGIYRDVRLLMAPARHIAWQGVRIDTVSLDPATVHVGTELVGPSARPGEKPLAGTTNPNAK